MVIPIGPGRLDLFDGYKYDLEAVFFYIAITTGSIRDTRDLNSSIDMTEESGAGETKHI